jgi:adenylosuccinate synthase
MPIPVCVAIDTVKTVLQVDSVEGFRSLMRRVKAGNFNVLYEGAYANAISAILGHYPWVRDLVCIRSWLAMMRSLMPFSYIFRFPFF